jgi:hypothetical protein
MTQIRITTNVEPHSGFGRHARNDETMTAGHLEHVERSRTALLRAIGEPDDLIFVRPAGNIGDRLIHAGTRRLLSGLRYREVGVAEARKCSGPVALLGGCGGWCGPYHGLPNCLRVLEARFDRVIVMPSSFDTTFDEIRRALAASRSLFFAREEVSFRQIRELCRAEIAHDCAFFFDFEPYRRTGQGVLTAFRTDRESAFAAVPAGNQDISIECGGLDQWLDIIAHHDLIRTDRAHVTIAGALLGKRVEYLSSSYHKVPAIVDYALRSFPVSRLPGDWMQSAAAGGRRLTDAERMRLLLEAVNTRIPPNSKFILVDHCEIGPFPLGARRRLPFLERAGAYWGPPPDDTTAIRELERMREGGVEFVLVGWPAFWWLKAYPEFVRHLRSTCACLLENDAVHLFDIRSEAARGEPAGRHVAPPGPFCRTP